ncbi:MAG: TonB-dependent receptor domain-containing protein, partial [Sulfurihydrogenibium sp.]
KVYIKDKEIPDTPKYMFKVGANIRIEQIKTNIYPSLQYVSSRYGDFTNKEKIGSYTVVNLSANTRISRNFTLYADIINLFDRKYIGRIRPNTQSGTYYVAAPFTMAVGIKAEF